METKKTAVELLANDIQEHLNIFLPGAILDEGMIEQAKEMEKGQMKDMFENGVERGYDCFHSNEWAEEPTSPNFEQYYNETYGN